MKFLLVQYDNQNQVFDILDDDDIARICAHTISDDAESELFYSDREPELEEILDAMDACILTKEEALERVLSEKAKYASGALSEQIAVAQAGEAYNKIKNEVIAKMEANGFEVYRNKNNSVYFERDNVKVRFSNHPLGSDFSGRQQTGGVAVDFVFESKIHSDFDAGDIAGDIEFEIEQL